MDFFYMRNPSIAMVARGKSYFFLRPGDVPITIVSTDVEKLSKFMQTAARPLSEIQVNELIGEDIKMMLCEHKILLHAPQPVLQMLLPAVGANAKPCKHLVLGLTGAVSSLQVVPFVLDLLDSFAEKVDVILTDGALHLINPEAFSFFGVQAWTDTFAARTGINVPHIQLAEAATMVAVIPASAHTLQKLSQAVCSDLLSLVIAATQAPVVLFPAMNCAMWNNPAVNRNIRQLREDGFYVVDPSLGREVAHVSDQELSYGVPGVAGIGLGKFLADILAIHCRVLKQ